MQEAIDATQHRDTQRREGASLATAGARINELTSDAHSSVPQKRSVRLVPNSARTALELEILQKFVLLADVPRSDLARIALHMQPKSLKSGDLFSGEDFGEPSVSFLYAGQCRVTILSPGGQHAAVRFVRPGSHFGEISILAEAVESPYHLLVDENSLIFQLSARKFRELLRSIPTLNENVLRNLARTAMARADRIYEFSLLDANLRLQAELLRLAQSGVRVGNQVTISNAPTREAVGTQIGISREGVSRLLHSLVQLGLIALKRSEIKIIDIKRLEANVARATGRSLRYRGEHRDWE